MNAELLAFLGAAGGTLGGVIIALITQRGLAGKAKADEAETYKKIALDLIEPYQKEQEKHLRRIEILEDLITAKNGTIANLTDRVQALEDIVDVKDGTIKERDLKISQQATQIANLETKVCQLEGEVAALRAQLPDWKPGDGDRRQG
jgi:uncharacterized protein (DUF3084 family)